MSFEIQPGWYKSNLPFLPQAIQVHSVDEGMVFFTRRGYPHMSIMPLKNFIGIITRPTK